MLNFMAQICAVKLYQRMEAMERRHREWVMRNELDLI